VAAEVGTWQTLLTTASTCMIEVMMELQSDEVIDQFTVVPDDLLLLGMMKILHKSLIV
jgi:hypothetical protein